MPTGYTATLCEKDQTFSEFAALCARAFGACVAQRDNPMSELPKTSKKSTYHEEALATSKLELKQLKKMSKKEITQFGRAKKARQLQYCKDAIAKKLVVRARLQKMLAQVNGWEPPNESFAEYKAFMIEQLTTTIEHDGDPAYYEKELAKAKRKRLRDYYDEEIERVKWSINYHKKEDVKEEDRTTERNKWITDLFQSLNNYDGELAWKLLSQNSSM